MTQGFCRGGPLAGQQWESRFPKGFLLVDKQANQCWIYDWADGEFVCREEIPYAVSLEGRRRAAIEPNYDVIAAPWVVSDDD